MANTFYEPGDRRASKVSDLFGTIAPRYDFLNDLQSFGLHRLWKRRLVGLARVRPGDRALDVCCGTGDIAFALASRGAQVVGLDFSDAMLAVARERQAGAQPQATETSAAANPLFLRGDAMKLPFPDGSFEIVTVGYGLRNLAAWETGLSEMQRVARSGGRLLVLDFGKPDFAPWRGAYFAYLRLCVPVLGRLFAGSTDAYAYILESLKHYPAQRGVAARMTAMGLADVRVLNLLGGIMSINVTTKP